MPFRRCAEVALLEDYFPTNLRWFRVYVLFTTVQYVFYASLLTYSRDKYKQYSYGSSNGPISITTSSHVSISSFASPGSSCVYVILLHILMDYTLVFVHAHKQMQVYRTTRTRNAPDTRQKGPNPIHTRHLSVSRPGLGPIRHPRAPLMHGQASDAA